jgi:hypothetical protein
MSVKNFFEVTRKSFVSFLRSFKKHLFYFDLSKGVSIFSVGFVLFIMESIDGSGLEMGGTTGDHERGLLAPLCHCLTPQGWWRFPTES